MVVFNHSGLVLVGDRIQYPGSFQFPQGGIEDGESPIDAAKRELLEETGLSVSEPVGEMADWIKYDFPEDIPNHLKKYRGQKQKWFFFEWNGDINSLKIDGEGQEFRTIKWTTLSTIVEEVIYFKQDIYKKIAEAAIDVISMRLHINKSDLLQ